MRRSVREATIGFSLLASLVAGLGFWFWLSGVVFGQKTWSFRLRFRDAAGLAPQSVVTYQGVPVGSIDTVTPEAGFVKVTAQINDIGLKLYRPISAQIRSGSLLGGNPQVALETTTAIPTSSSEPGPLNAACNPTRLICKGGLVQGDPTPSLTTVMGLMESLLLQAEQDKVISKGATTLTALTKTSEDFSALAERAEELIVELQEAVQDATPMIDNLNAATAEARSTFAHASNIVGTLDNPKSLNELRNTVSNAEQLTRRLDAISGDVEKLSGDPNFINGLRSVTVGLGMFFDELYPSIRKEPPEDAESSSGAT